MSHAKGLIGVTKHFDEDTKSIFTLKIDDVLQGNYLTVDGIQYDTHATFEFRRVGKAGAIEVVYSNTERSWYVVIHRTQRGVETLPLDWNALRTGFKDDLLAALGLRALNTAKKSSRWERAEND